MGIGCADRSGADELLTAAGVNDVLHSLVIDGMFNGVGSVLSFLPIIVTLFFFLSLLEDSGYMARVAFVMDKLLTKDRSFRTKYRAYADWLWLHGTRASWQAGRFLRSVTER